MKKIIATIVLMLPVQMALADHHIANAVTADPDHYVVEFENDVLRVIRINYGAGESSVMHAHDANCAITLTAGTFKMERPDGSVDDAPVSDAGDVNCGDAEVHLPMNAGDTNASVILVELKGRETF